jgi:hypothetical protein
MSVDRTRQDALQRMLDFLDFLREKGIHFTIQQKGEGSLTVSFALIGARVEADFDVDGMHFSVFKGSEAVETDKRILDELIKEHWDD